MDNMFYNITAFASVDEHDKKGFIDILRGSTYNEESNRSYYSPTEFKYRIGVNRWAWDRKQYTFQLTCSIPTRYFDDYEDASGYIMETLMKYVNKAVKMLEENYDIDTACKIIQDEIRIMLPIKLKLLKMQQA